MGLWLELESYIIVIKGRAPPTEVMVCEYGKGKPPGLEELGPPEFTEQDKEDVNEDLQKLASEWKRGKKMWSQPSDGSGNGAAPSQKARVEETEESLPVSFAKEGSDDNRVYPTSTTGPESSAHKTSLGGKHAPHVQIRGSKRALSADDDGPPPNRIKRK